MSAETAPPLTPQEQKLARTRRNSRYKEMIEDAELLARLKKAYRDQAVYEAERLEAYARMAQLQGALEEVMQKEEGNTTTTDTTTDTTDTTASASPNPEQPAQDPNPESARVVTAAG